MQLLAALHGSSLSFFKPNSAGATFTAEVSALLPETSIPPTMMPSDAILVQKALPILLMSNTDPCWSPLSWTVKIKKQKQDIADNLSVWPIIEDNLIAQSQICISTKMLQISYKEHES